MKPKINKAIFPVAGLGTRFLPATKANPKEMLPIVDKPLIQYAVEEAVSAGISELIFVTSSAKRPIEDHFDSNYELEDKLAKAGKQELLAIVKNVLPKGVSCAYVRQPEALGLGHAVLCARSLINDEPFAVLLADDLIDGGEVSCLEQMVAVFSETQNSVIAVQEVPHNAVHRYGIVDVDRLPHPLAKILEVIEKPALEDAPSNLGIVGRYIFKPTLFNFLDRTLPDAKGEIQLTDAIAQFLETEVVNALRFSGIRYDCGSKLGYLQATIAYALKHAEIKDEFKTYLSNLFYEEEPRA